LLTFAAAFKWVITNFIFFFAIFTRYVRTSLASLHICTAQMMTTFSTLFFIFIHSFLEEFFLRLFNIHILPCLCDRYFTFACDDNENFTSISCAWYLTNCNKKLWAYDESQYFRGDDLN
jgi:hypothetical protein